MYRPHVLAGPVRQPVRPASPGSARRASGIAPSGLVLMVPVGFQVSPACPIRPTRRRLGGLGWTPKHGGQASQAAKQPGCAPMQTLARRTRRRRRPAGDARREA